MTTFNRGEIVEFGPASARRIGVVVGAFDDYQRGETLCVLQINFCFTASATASVRLVTASLLRMLLTWNFTVDWLT